MNQQEKEMLRYSNLINTTCDYLKDVVNAIQEERKPHIIEVVLLSDCGTRETVETSGGNLQKRHALFTWALALKGDVVNVDSRTLF